MTTADELDELVKAAIRRNSGENPEGDDSAEQHLYALGFSDGDQSDIWHAARTYAAMLRALENVQSTMNAITGFVELKYEVREALALAAHKEAGG